MYARLKTDDVTDDVTYDVTEVRYDVTDDVTEVRLVCGTNVATRRSVSVESTNATTGQYSR